MNFDTQLKEAIALREDVYHQKQCPCISGPEGSPDALELDDEYRKAVDMTNRLIENLVNFAAGKPL